MYDNIFNIDWKKFIILMLPIGLRKPKRLYWLFSLIVPFRDIYNSFLQYRDKAIYKITHTPQVYSIENVLNDAFDNQERRIFIRDGIYRFPVYFYDRADDKPVRFYDRADDQPVYFYDRATLENIDVDFVVVLPLGLTLIASELIRLQSLIDFYKLPDKTYTITYE